jgi:tRNA(fMet)-specific endonuclease VapC
VALSTGKTRTARQALLDELIATLPVLAYDLGVAEDHARLLVSVREHGRPRGAHDLLIAATARSSRRTVLTADPTAFDDLPGVDIRTYR